MRKAYIYGLYDSDDVLFYVGKTTNIKRRMSTHIARTKKYTTTYLYNKLRSLLAKGHILNIQIIEETTEVEVDNREIYWIQFYRDSGVKLCNVTNGGEGGCTSESAIKGAETRKRNGYSHSDETKHKMSIASKGVAKSNAHKKALKKSWKRTPEQLHNAGAKASVTSKGKINIKQYICISPRGEEFITKNGLTLFCEEHGLTPSNMHKVVSGVRPHHKGWRIKNIGDINDN